MTNVRVVLRVMTIFLGSFASVIGGIWAYRKRIAAPVEIHATVTQSLLDDIPLSDVQPMSQDQKPTSSGTSVKSSIALLRMLMKGECTQKMFQHFQSHLPLEQRRTFDVVWKNYTQDHCPKPNDLKEGFRNILLRIPLKEKSAQPWWRIWTHLQQHVQILRPSRPQTILDHIYAALLRDDFKIAQNLWNQSIYAQHTDVRVSQWMQQLNSYNAWMEWMDAYVQTLALETPK